MISVPATVLCFVFESSGIVLVFPSLLLPSPAIAQVVDFWFGDVERYDSDKEYASSFAGKWWGFGPKDEAFIASQVASKDLIQKAAK